MLDRSVKVQFTEGSRVALRSLAANKLRSILTLIGVVLGVAAVIFVVTLVKGINRYFAEKVFNLGADVFIISKISPVVTNIDQLIEGQKRKDLTMDDFAAIKGTCGRCTLVGASASNMAGKIKYEEQSSSDTWIRGMTPEMTAIYDIDLAEGRMLNQNDIDNRSSVVVIGMDIVENLMPGVDPVGKEIRVEGIPYQVIGVAKRQGKTLGMSRDNFVGIPISAFLKQFGSHTSIRISGKADGIGTRLDAAIDEARVVLRSRRHDRPGEDDSFATETNASLVGLWSSISGTFFLAMIGIAAVSLVVGGIVIMNIMLVSVTERTREIGIRKAMGARRNDVLLQFLIESSLLALIGGAIGVLLGVGGAKLVTWGIGIPSSIELWTIAIGLTVATSVGLFFGVYPARRAAMLDPIAALRHEM
jgi:putative ABC transport system permease protein